MCPLSLIEGRHFDLISDDNKLPSGWSGFWGLSSNPNKFMSWVWLHILKDPSVSFSYIIKGDQSLGKSFHDMVFPNKWHHLCLSINGVSNHVEGVLVNICLSEILCLIDN